MICKLVGDIPAFPTLFKMTADGIISVKNSPIIDVAYPKSYTVSKC